MLRPTRLSVFSGLGLAALLWTAACGDDDKSNDKPADAGMRADAASDKDSATGKEDAGATDGADAGDDERDAGDLDAGDVDAGDGGVTLDPDASPATYPLPTDGKELSACWVDKDCADGLVCAAPGDTAPGFCTPSCSAQKACTELGGQATTCISGACLFDCASASADAGPSSDAATLGTCPAYMQCDDVNSGVLFAQPAYRCHYPEGGGGNGVAEFGRCEPSHGAGDCAGELSCHAPEAASPFSEAGPGYCAASCSADGDCGSGGSSAKPVCNQKLCELDCSAAGATCPTGMNCRDVDGSALSELYRCVYIAP